MTFGIGHEPDAHTVLDQVMGFAGEDVDAVMARATAAGAAELTGPWRC